MGEPSLRSATLGDADRIEALMQVSAKALFPLFYAPHEAASAVRHVARVDRALLDEGTYFVLEDGDELVACGGWSRKDHLHAGCGEPSGEECLLDPASEAALVRAMFVHPARTRQGLGRRILEASESAAAAEGFRSLRLMATLPGVPLYRACGYLPIVDTDVVLADGVTIPCVEMGKETVPIASARAEAR